MTGAEGLLAAHPGRPPKRRIRSRKRLRVIPTNGVRLQPRLLDLHLDATELLVGLGVGRLVDEQVLAAQLFLDRLVDRRQLLGLVDEEAPPAGVLGELLERLLRLPLEVLAEADGVDRHPGAAR